MPDVGHVYLWENGMVMTFDTAGQQIPDLQGPHTAELVAAIRTAADEWTVWHGFTARPCRWRDYPGVAAAVGIEIEETT